MKISEFAKENNVTTKMLRYYDEIDLLKPASIDPLTGYREYSPDQSSHLNWIIILKNLGFSLSAVKVFIEEDLAKDNLIMLLRERRMSITNQMNEGIQKKLIIDKLISLIEKEGNIMNSSINIMNINQENIHELKKHIPNMEVFLEGAKSIIVNSSDDQEIGFLRLDIAKFKQVNDKYGYSVGDHVIWAVYSVLNKYISTYSEKATLARAHGDEFVACIVGNPSALSALANSIIQDIKAIDYNSFGCMETKECYIGIVMTRAKELKLIRKNIDNTIEALEAARKEGPSHAVFYNEKIRS